MANIKGGNKNDVLKGTNGADRLQGLGGHDWLYGFSGNDTLEGGGGDDVLQGGAGSDTIDGGVGTDTLDYSDWATGIRVDFGGYSTETRGYGTVKEYDANGVVVSTDTFDNIENIFGGAGNDQFFGNAAANLLRGGGGRDFMFGGGGNDAIYGEAGDDLIDIGNGNDLLDGGTGIDTIFWYAGGSYYAPIIDLEAGTITYVGSTADFDTLVSIENVRGNSHDDQIFGSSAANALTGGGGDDLIEGRAGNDLLIGDNGRFIGGIGADPGNDRLFGGDGDDTLVGDFGDDILSGGSGRDLFQFDEDSGDDRIIDFESGVDSVALYGGVGVLSWQLRDSDGDGTADSQVALLSDGSSILFVGHADAPILNLTQSANPLVHVELAFWL